MSILEKLKSIKDWEDKYQYIVQLGKSIKLMPFEYKTQNNLIKSCQSKVYIYYQNNTFQGDSDSLIMKGLLCLLFYIESTGKPLELIYDIGISESISLSRRNGLNDIIKRIKELAG